MSQQLEDRLGAHLGQSSTNHEVDPADLAKVKQRARRRSVRTRAVVGVCGLAVLAGLGSLVPMDDSTDSLVTATEPGPGDIFAEDSAPSVDSPSSHAQPDPTPDVGDADLPDRAVAPPGFEIVSDGQGGFIALRTRTSRGIVTFARSDDGENWFKAEAGQLPEGFRVERLRFVDGHFVLTLDKDGGVTGMVERPYLALSTDLMSWQLIDLGLGPDDQGDAASTDYGISQIAINGTDIAVAVMEFRDFDYSRYGVTESDVCGFVKNPASSTIALCDGTAVPVEDSQVTLPRLQYQVLVSRNGEPAAALPGSPPVTVDPWGSQWFSVTPIQRGESFFVFGPDTDPATIVGAATLDVLADKGPAQIVAAAANPEQELLILQAGATLLPVVISEAGEVIGSFPDSVNQVLDPTNLPIRIEHGPAGWVASIADYRHFRLRIKRNGWEFSGFAGSTSAQLSSADGAETIFYNTRSNALPPSVRVSLFGSVRYHHPTTGELLFELSAAEASVSSIDELLIEQSTFDRTVEVEGWTVSGHPLLGPLTLTSPSGENTVYSDGFAFDNDDIADGVETEIGSSAFGSFALERAGVITFYDNDGNKLVEVRGRELFNEMVVPVLGTPNDSGRYVLETRSVRRPGDAVVLHSTNGIDWEIIWSSEDADTDEQLFIFNLAVGDDEILLATPVGVVRIPIGD